MVSTSPQPKKVGTRCPVKGEHPLAQSGVPFPHEPALCRGRARISARRADIPVRSNIRSPREVGQTLGTNEDAARKRISRAVESLRQFFAKRGVTISTAAALVGTSLATTVSATATKAIVMTTLQKTLITATIALTVGTKGRAFVPRGCRELAKTLSCLARR
jgi:hypothetical protein